jgi:Big-like domain-containing protein
VKARLFTVILLALTMAAGCGGKSSSGSDSQAAVALTASKTKALANGADVVTIKADVRNPDRTAVADGTLVTFSVPNNAGTLSAPSVLTSNGLATVSLTSSSTRTISVAATAATISGTIDIRFISQPSRADVFIAFDRPVTNLAALSFNLLNSIPAVAFDNASQPIAAINAASGPQSLVAGNFNASSSINTIGLVQGGTGGFNTGTAPIIKATYTVNATSVLPVFSVDVTSAATFTASDPDFSSTFPPVTAANLVVTVTFDTEQ